MDGRTGRLGTTLTHSVRLGRDLANTDVSRGQSRWCPAYVQSEQALVNTTEVTRWQCSVSFGWQPTNDPTSPPVDLWGVPGGSAMDVAGGGESRDERHRAAPLRSARMMGQQKTHQKTHHKASYQNERRHFSAND